MAATPGGNVQAKLTGERQRLGDVLGRRAQSHRLRRDLIEAGNERAAHPLVILRPRKQKLAPQ